MPSRYHASLRGDKTRVFDVRPFSGQNDMTLEVRRSPGYL